MTIWLDGGFWSRYFNDVFIKYINAYHDAIVNRVLPTFNNIEKEADDIANSVYDKFGSMPASGDETWDMGDAAEVAQEAGFAHYEATTAARQSIINMAVTSLYHILEQQLLLFHRRQLLHKSEEDDISKINFKELNKRLSDGGIDITILSSWRKINELRLAANAVKHAEGGCSDQLKRLRPDLFEAPHLKNMKWAKMTSIVNVQLPLAGEDIYLSIDDLNDYKSALISFWEEFGALIKKHSEQTLKIRKPNNGME